MAEEDDTIMADAASVGGSGSSSGVNVDESSSSGSRRGDSSSFALSMPSTVSGSQTSSQSQSTSETRSDGSGSNSGTKLRPGNSGGGAQDVVKFRVTTHRVNAPSSSKENSSLTESQMSFQHDPDQKSSSSALNDSGNSESHQKSEQENVVMMETSTADQGQDRASKTRVQSQDTEEDTGKGPGKSKIVSSGYFPKDTSFTSNENHEHEATSSGTGPSDSNTNGLAKNANQIQGQKFMMHSESEKQHDEASIVKEEGPKIRHHVFKSSLISSRNKKRMKTTASSLTADESDFAQVKVEVQVQVEPSIRCGGDDNTPGDTIGALEGVVGEVVDEGKKIDIDNSAQKNLTDDNATVRQDVSSNHHHPSSSPSNNHGNIKDDESPLKNNNSDKNYKHNENSNNKDKDNSNKDKDNNSTSSKDNNIADDNKSDTSNSSNFFSTSSDEYNMDTDRFSSGYEGGKSGSHQGDSGISSDSNSGSGSSGNNAKAGGRTIISSLNRRYHVHTPLSHGNGGSGIGENSEFGSSGSDDGYTPTNNLHGYHHISNHHHGNSMNKRDKKKMKLSESSTTSSSSSSSDRSSSEENMEVYNMNIVKNNGVVVDDAVQGGGENGGGGSGGNSNAKSGDGGDTVGGVGGGVGTGGGGAVATKKNKKQLSLQTAQRSSSLPVSTSAATTTSETMSNSNSNTSSATMTRAHHGSSKSGSDNNIAMGNSNSSSFKVNRGNVSGGSGGSSSGDLRTSESGSGSGSGSGTRGSGTSGSGSGSGTAGESNDSGGDNNEKKVSNKSSSSSAASTLIKNNSSSNKKDDAGLMKKKSGMNDVSAPSQSIQRMKKPAPYFYYDDYSQELEEDLMAPLVRPLHSPSFVIKLHAVLMREDLKGIIHWLPHGRSWKIVHEREFEIRTLPTYFNHTKISSFYRQADEWGFQRIKKGPDQGTFYHERFLRALPHLCKNMKGANFSSKIVKVESDDDNDSEPNFWQISFEHPIPENLDLKDVQYLELRLINDCILDKGHRAKVPATFVRSEESRSTALQKSVLQNVRPTSPNVISIGGDRTAFFVPTKFLNSNTEQNMDSVPRESIPTQLAQPKTPMDQDTKLNDNKRLVVPSSSRKLSEGRMENQDTLKSNEQQRACLKQRTQQHTQQKQSTQSKQGPVMLHSLQTSMTEQQQEQEQHESNNDRDQQLNQNPSQQQGSFASPNISHQPKEANQTSFFPSNLFGLQAQYNPNQVSLMPTNIQLPQGAFQSPNPSLGASQTSFQQFQFQQTQQSAGMQMLTGGGNVGIGETVNAILASASANSSDGNNGPNPDELMALIHHTHRIGTSDPNYLDQLTQLLAGSNSSQQHQHEQPQEVEMPRQPHQQQEHQQQRQQQQPPQQHHQQQNSAPFINAHVPLNLDMPLSQLSPSSLQNIILQCILAGAQLGAQRQRSSDDAEESSNSGNNYSNNGYPNQNNMPPHGGYR